MKRSKSEEPRKDLLEGFLKDKAQKAARELIEEISAKAARDVDTRLRHLAPEGGDAQEHPPSGRLERCGREEQNREDVRSGYDDLFRREFRLAKAALNRGDGATAAYHYGQCLLMPLGAEEKTRQMLRQQLTQALALLKRLREG